jgi:8-oxo-dGTP pyrophosphatase MutT (NUDIX family)
MHHPNVHFHAIGDYPPGGVRAKWVADSRPRIPQIEAAIEAAWRDASHRLKLFDGPICRLESFEAGDTLDLNVSMTSYKIFIGTNLANPQFTELYGPATLANGIGVSTIVLSHDDSILMGRRNESVAQYPLRVHTFGGTLEPRDPLDVFAEARRELIEELRIDERDVEAIACIGLVEDTTVHQPELIFAARLGRTVAQLEQSLDPREHGSLIRIPAQPASLAAALQDRALTPVGGAALMLLERSGLVDRWSRY